MKKNLVFVCGVLATLSLMAFGMVNWAAPSTIAEKNSEVDLLYKVDSRFIWKINKSDLLQATSIKDVYPKNSTNNVIAFKEVNVGWYSDKGEIIVKGKSEKFNEGQLELIQSIGYSDNFYVTAECIKQYTSCNSNNGMAYYFTVMPEQEAQYVGGQKALIDYLKSNSQKETAMITKDMLRPGRVFFTIAKDGKIKNVELDATSGYNSVDKHLVNLVKNIPGKWQPATNANGEPVEQTLTFFFGLQGC